jgi:hypothetical protein
MPLPSLYQWDATAHSLHKAIQLLGALRALLFEPVPNALHLAEKIKQEGVSSDVLPGGSEVTVDFREAALAVRQHDGLTRTIPLTGHTQGSLLEVMLVDLQTSELATILTGNGTLTSQFIEALAAKKNRPPSYYDYLRGNQPLEVDPNRSADYSTALYAIFTGVARFRARLNGFMTPIVVWPEHFDLSFLWFATDKADENAAHLNFGFAPYSAGIDFPYLYVTAYPMPEDVALPPLPASAYWNTEGWTGVVLPYTEIARANDSELFVEIMCGNIFKALRPLLG